jgi:histone-lysine N-methyltransferase SETMAR
VASALGNGVVCVKEGRTNVHDEERSGQPSVINDDLVVKVLDHPPYSPDLAPSDYHLFMHQKQWLGSESFEDADRLKTGVTTRFKSLAADFYDTGTRKLVPRYQKCVEVSGDCVE